MLSPCAEVVRRHDPDRFLCTLFAPPPGREALFTLYATNHELARAREAVSQPMLALIRLQWWREIAEGARRRHEVAGPLGDALDTGVLQASDVLTMIEGREAEAEPIADEAAFRSYIDVTAGCLAMAAGRVLGGAGPALGALRDLGAAYGVAGVLRSIPSLARQGRCLLPEALLATHGLSPEHVIARPDDPALNPVRARLLAMGRDALASGRRMRLP
ncbi:MAG: squalene/phytoene synthase family protein, partial [Gemmatimonadaceae bacterium]|nr:squalene/phytoene synthase family protein [Acetobacteraceae bacterium]